MEKGGEEPRNGHLIKALLEAMGVGACEPRVVHQLLELTHSMSLFISFV